MTMRERIAAGKLFTDYCEGLPEDRTNCKKRMNCWIGAGVTICPGVHIGENSVIGAGSVVIHDIPANSVAAGNPCRVIREIGEQDQKYYYKDRVIDPLDLEEEHRLR